MKDDTHTIDVAYHCHKCDTTHTKESVGRKFVGFDLNEPNAYVPHCTICGNEDLETI